MDLNYVLGWLAGISAGLGFVRVLSSRRADARSWALPCGIVLAVLGTGLLWWPKVAGFAAMAAWTAFVALPLFGSRAVAWLAANDYLATAAMVADVIGVMRFGAEESQGERLRLLGRASATPPERLTDFLASLRTADPELTRLARLAVLANAGRWTELKSWVDAFVPEGVLLADSFAASLYSRALAETGEESRLLALAQAWWWRLPNPTRSYMTLVLAAFAGRVRLVELLFRGPLRSVGARKRSFWVATALQASGEGERALPLLNRLASRGRAATRRDASHRLANPLRPRGFELGALEPAFASLESGLEEQATYGAIPDVHWPRVTLLFMALNLVAFAFEIPGGTENLDNLVEMGALVVPMPAYLGSPWWRFVAAGFLHFGWLHVVLNVLGIWVLGSYLERTWGPRRMFVCYLVAVIGANATAAQLLSGSSFEPVVMVGASTGVMGILGASVASIMVAWRRRKVEILRRQRNVYLAILALQLIFDHYTPMISSTLHVSGFLFGAFAGALFELLSPRR